MLLTWVLYRMFFFKTGWCVYLVGVCMVACLYCLKNGMTSFCFVSSCEWWPFTILVPSGKGSPKMQMLSNGTFPFRWSCGSEWQCQWAGGGWGSQRGRGGRGQVQHCLAQHQEAHLCEEQDWILAHSGVLLARHPHSNTGTSNPGPPVVTQTVPPSPICSYGLVIVNVIPFLWCVVLSGTEDF